MTRYNELEIVAKFLEMEPAELVGLDTVVMVVMVAEKCVQCVKSESGRVDLLVSAFGIALAAQGAKIAETERRLQHLTDKLGQKFSAESSRRLIEGRK